MAQRLSDRLYQEATQDTDLRPRWDGVRVLAYALAGVIHLITFGVVVAAAYLIVHYGVSPVPVVFGLALLVVAWLIRPRLGRVPKRANRLTRDSAPNLYDLIDRIAKQLGAHRIDVVVVDRSFNASMATVGLRRQRVLTIGVQLWTILTPAERLAILGHELAHDVNGDSTRGLVVGSALSALQEWHRLLTPARSPRPISPTKAMDDLVGWLFMKPMASVVQRILVTEQRLVFYGSQRAEYLADELAATVAGTHATASGLEKLRLGPACGRALERAVKFDKATDIWAVQRRYADAFPQHESERLRRLDARRPARLELTHPATYRRVAALRARPSRQPHVVLSDSEVSGIDGELAPSFQKITQAIRQLFGVS